MRSGRFMVTTAISGRGRTIKMKDTRRILERQLAEPREHRALVVLAERQHRVRVLLVGGKRLVELKPRLVLGARLFDEHRKRVVVEMASEPQRHEEREAELF